MKLIYLLVICISSLATMASAELKVPIPPPNDNKNLPQLSGGGGGSRKQGFDVNINAQQKVWESDDKRHTFGVIGGYSQHLGGPYGNSPADKRIGAAYSFKF